MYDLTTIKRISKNDPAVIRKYIQAFIDSSNEALKAIDGYMAENKWDDIADVLHKMKTSVAYFFMNELEQKVINAEMNIKKGVDKTTIRDQIKEINRLLTDVFQSLQEEINSPAEKS
jgi:HPt (histidine-containing phosphotransfer) domain-containing protein